jgi:hypothetical protein
VLSSSQEENGVAGNFTVDGLRKLVSQKAGEFASAPDDQKAAIAADSEKLIAIVKAEEVADEKGRPLDRTAAAAP